MDSENDLYLAYTTLADEAAAQRLAQGLVAEHLAACVQWQAPCRSVYPWQGQIETANEVVLTIKTSQSKLKDVASWIEAHHDYDLPELVWVRIDGGSEAYRRWARDWLLGHQ